MKYFLCIFFSILINSSQISKSQQTANKKDRNDIIINLDHSDGTDNKASLLFQNPKAIILETNSESIIGRVTGIQIFDGKIFLIDKISAKSLFVFDMDGKFIRKIGRIGRGPGEYASISDFTIDTVKKEIYTLDGAQNIMHKYSVDGAYINSVRIADQSSFNAIQFYNGKIYAAVDQYKKNGHLLILIEPATGKVLEGYLSTKDKKGWNRSDQYAFHNRTYGIPKYAGLFMNTIWSLDNMITPYITVESKNFVKEAMVEEIKRDADPLSWRKIDKIRCIDVFFETEKIIFFQYMLNKRCHTCFYRKSNKTITNSNFFVDDLVCQMPCLFQFDCIDEGGVYQVMHMTRFEQFQDLKLLNENLEQRERLIALNEESNPVIFYYKFKDQ